MAGKFSRSWQILTASAAVLRQDKRLLIFPLISTVVATGLIAAFGLVYLWLEAFEYESTGGLTRYAPYALGCVFYFVAYLVAVVCNTALVAVATAHMDGGSPTISDGLRFTWARMGNIIGYTLIAATVGVMLRSLQERLGAVGAFIAGLTGIAWTVATFLVVPVLVNQNVGPVDAIRESARLLKKTWGENIIANGGMGLIFSIFYILFGFLAIFATIVTLLSHGNLDAGQRTIATGTVVLAWFPLVVLLVLHGALQGIYSAALYRFATHASDQIAGIPIPPTLLESAFGPRNQSPKRRQR